MKKITETEYLDAKAKSAEAEKVISKYHEQKDKDFEDRLKTNPIFSEDELIFAAFNRCPCGYGLAYPKNCTLNHYWDCAGILMDKASKSIRHAARLPFMYYEIKSEDQPSANGSTTRGTVIPQTTPNKTGDKIVGESND